MKKTVLTFGLLAGAVLATSMAISMYLFHRGSFDLDKGLVFGYTSMILAFLFVFFGIRSFREHAGGGAITFGKAFQVGILVTLVASAIYVITWEVIYFNFLPDFADRYAATMIEKARAKGATAETIDATAREMARFKEMYKNPLINVGMTFAEVFPVGFVLTLVSAGILRKKRAA